MNKYTYDDYSDDLRIIREKEEDFRSRSKMSPEDTDRIANAFTTARIAGMRYSMQHATKEQDTTTLEIWDVLLIIVTFVTGFILGALLF